MPPFGRSTSRSRSSSPAARVVELAGLEAAERAAGQGLAKAQAAGISFELKRSRSDAGIVSLRIGPTLDG